ERLGVLARLLAAEIFGVLREGERRPYVVEVGVLAHDFRGEQLELLARERDALVHDTLAGRWYEGDGCERRDVAVALPRLATGCFAVVNDLPVHGSADSE